MPYCKAEAAGDTDSVASMVEAMSRALGAFSDEVADAIKTLFTT